MKNNKTKNRGYSPGSNVYFKKGFFWGRKLLKNNFELEGKIGLMKADKACSTCSRYATDKKLTETKNGKRLTAAKRQFYKGVASGILHEYNKMN